MRRISSEQNAPPPLTEGVQAQEPFSRVAPVVRTALLMGVCGGFLLAAVLTVTAALSLPPGAWWEALAQAHGHLQLYGWAGLFVLGVTLHFFPRLRGTPLAGARFVPWLLGILIASLVLRAVCQPLMSLSSMNLVWRLGLVGSGICEAIAFAGVLVLLVGTASSGPPPATRPAYWGVLPFFAGAFCSLGVASIVNLVNAIQAAQESGLVLDAGDALNVLLGLFGFLIPVALAMSARSLPMYAGLQGFPRRVLWPLAGAYFLGVILLCAGVDGGPLPASWSGIVAGLAMVVLGAVVLLFVGIFLRLMRRRGQLPERVAKLALSPEALARSYRRQIKQEQTSYGPFVGLVASAYLWAMLGAVLLLIEGGSLLATGSELLAFDAIRHTFAIGFIALLICGIAPRMLPGFSGGSIASPKLVSATLWLGNAAAVLRAGSILFAPFFGGTPGMAVDTILFSLSGPCGLALAICLTVNLWPALRSSPHRIG
jgi:uncharacterized protein involved in response to NO